ncbi:probable serine racemase [Branchiostoma floridae]|uniref:L-serine ammonia-lyase n=1 Tax=Branchiostoma floridae TaxID=7739 RepID=A0A9J7HLW8_BRAFL|nr:probable serine racemase [Branchiostoma floridae]
MEGKMTDLNGDLLTIEQISGARQVLQTSGLCFHTPVLHHVQTLCGLDSDIDLYLKLENMQNTGSFKIRGLVNQMTHISDSAVRGQTHLISMSCGNFGKAFAYMVQQKGLKGTVFMPDTASASRAELIKSYGVGVKMVPMAELEPAVNKCLMDSNTMNLFHDNIDVMAGNGRNPPGIFCGYVYLAILEHNGQLDCYRFAIAQPTVFVCCFAPCVTTSVGLEILEDVPDPDVVVVCCGGGGLLGGTAAAIKLSGRSNTRVYGVEPEGAPSMYESRKAVKPVVVQGKTKVLGLAPPYTGYNAFRLNVEFVDDVVLVSDDEIVAAVKRLFSRGLVVEPAGAAAFAAVMSGKIPDVKGKKVVVVITGGNVTTQELNKICG